MSDSDTDIPDNVRHAVISEYRESCKAQRDMERAVRDADILLMNPSQKYATAMRKFARSKKRWLGKLGHFVREYRRVMSRTPPQMRVFSEHQLREQCPHLIATAPVLRDFARRLARVYGEALSETASIETIFEWADPSESEALGDLVLSMVEEATELFETVLVSGMGIDDDTLPHPSISRAVVPAMKPEADDDDSDDDDDTDDE